MKYWVDPPAGWKYGFPRLWDPEQCPDIRDFFIQNGYPYTELELAVKYHRSWLDNTNN